jgi:rare lipoprotein A
MRRIGRLALTVFAAAACLPAAGYAAEEGWSESGQASWYGPRHEGLRTTSGERFDSTKLTAAHASLPLGTLVRVTLQSSGTSVIVRVNDGEAGHCRSRCGGCNPASCLADRGG